MFGRGKKTVSLAYKENLLAQIAHYEKRIEEALNRRKQNYFADESFSKHVTNPYKFSIQPSQHELKQQEANLSERASMTLELAMLTIMQSDVNVMVTPPDVRKPVQEDGVWHEVAAECKIDLVSFNISFYAHKPHRRFAPTRYRNVAVNVVKPAHEKELAQSILPKLKVPNLALQVLQSYATAVRSRRTTLLELAETYADKLNMQAMPEGGYRVRCLDLLQVDWTLENMWSPIVPFCHRMKFEVEYMPEEYISAIGKLYKQFKDPSLVTKERTLVLSKIFDICLQASAPARELHESFESDPETAGRLHERRTNIDQEPDVPHVEHSPKKPSAKENKHQNHKTNMAPPNAIPKKSKKLDKNKGTEKNVDSRKSVKRAIDNNGNNDAKKSKKDESNIDNGKGTPGLKGGSNAQDKESETGTIVERTNTGKESTVNANAEKNGIGSENKMNKRSKLPANNNKGSDKGPVSAKDHSSKKTDSKVVKAKTASSDQTNDVMTNTGIKNKDGNSKNTSDASSKGSKEGLVKRNGQTIDTTKDTNSESNDARPKKAQDKAKTKKDKIIEKDNGVPKDTEIKVNVVNSKPAKATTSKTSVKNTEEPKDTNNKNNEVISVSAKTRVSTKSGSMKVDNTKNNEVISVSTETRVSSKSGTMKVGNTKKNEVNIDGSKRVTKKDGEVEQIVAKVKNAGSDVAISNTRKTFTKHSGTEEQTERINDTETVTKPSSKTANSEGNYDKIKTSKYVIEKDVAISKKVANDIEEKVIIGGEVGQKKKAVHKAKTDVPKTMASQNAEKKKILKKTSDKDLKENKGNTGTKLGKAAEKTKVIREKNSETGHDKKQEKIILTEKSNMNHKAAELKVAQDINKKKTKAPRSAAQEKDNSDEILAKKRKTTEPDMFLTKKAKNDQSKKPVADKTEKYTGNSNPTENAKVLKVTNRDTLQKAVENNEQRKTVTNKMLNVTITKPKTIPISKIPVEKQIKIADKLKTKIPTMKSKMTFASLGNKLGMNNAGRITTMAEKTKIPLKSLPVFKKLSSNLPTRASPRKLPTFKPSSRGFLNK